jgi:DNA topoisomerase-3
VIWKNQDGKTVTSTMAKALAEKGETKKLSFKQANGEALKGKLLLNDRETGTVKVELEQG